MRTFTCQFHFPRQNAVRGLVAGLVLLTGVAMAEAQKFPGTGQTTCYDSAGSVIACAGTGQDGDTRAGAPLRYKDNGNGTITDRNTLLVWEKKSDDGTIHDVDNTYTWENAFAVHVAALNNMCKNDATVDCSANGDADCAGVGGKCGFAGKRDWRVPNVRELASISNYENVDPAVSAAFHTNCVAGATVLTGSCMGTSLFYWSSTSDTGTPSNAAGVHFLNGSVPYAAKSDPIHVRAVRGGQ